MTRLIDADKLREKWIWGSTDRTKNVECIELIDLDNAPTVDAVEVIRCKDCKKWERNTLIFTDCGTCSEDAFGDYEGYLDVETKEDDFCSRGERK